MAWAHFLLRLTLFVYSITPSEETCSVAISYGTRFMCENYRCGNRHYQENQIKCINVTINNDTEGLEVKGKYADVAISLIFYDSHINIIPSKTVNVYKTIKLLNLANCCVQSIDQEAFSGLVNLQDLHLQDNLISNISVGTFDNLTSLVMLNLSHCKLSHLEEHLFRDLTKLKTLDLSFNMISKINSNQFATTEVLETLLLNDNFMSIIQEKLLSDISKTVFNLNLSSNKIQAIDVSNMRGQIDLSFNLLTNITTFSDNITYLDVSRNVLSTLAASIFQYSRNLQQIILNQDDLIAIHEDLFADLKELNILQLSRNKLKLLHVGTFRGLISLKELDLTRNQLEYFEIGVFSSLRKLERLNIGSNKLSDIEATVLYPLTNLDRLDISNNLLTEQVIQNIFAHFHNTNIQRNANITIDINNNQLTCEWLMKTLRAQNFIFVEGASLKVTNIHGISCFH